MVAETAPAIGDDVESLRTTLEREAALLAGMIALADYERDAIGSGNADAYLSFITQRERLVEDLGDLEKRRVAIIAKLNDELGTGDEAALYFKLDEVLDPADSVALRAARDRVVNHATTTTIEHGAMATVIDHALTSIMVEQSLLAAAAGDDAYGAQGRGAARRGHSRLDLSA